MAWWMCHYDHPSPKRSKGYSNNRYVLKYDKGRLSRAKMSSVKPEHQTTKRYKDARGKSRFTGLPGLKKSQTLCSDLRFLHGSMFLQGELVCKACMWSRAW